LKIKKGIIIFFLIIFLSNCFLFAKWTLDVETGLVKSGYNDVRIPGNGGTDFSISKDFSVKDSIFYRLELVTKLNEKYGLRFLYAPLTLNADGVLNKNIHFNDKTFYSGSKIDALYQFNSYRITYFYSFLKSEKFKMDIGVTGKIRDARIRIKDGFQISEKSNIGFVPLIYIQTLTNISDKWAFICGGDMLAAPQGRAEDILTGFLYKVSPKVKLKAGYRFLEGGADNDEVYNFAFIHYFVIGGVFEF